MPKKYRQIVKILQQNGFEKVNQNGSHVKMFNAKTNKTTIVPKHGGKDIPLGTEKAIWKQAGLK